MGLASVVTTIQGLISGIGKPPVAYIGCREVKLVIYLVKGGLQEVWVYIYWVYNDILGIQRSHWWCKPFIDSDDHSGLYTEH